MLVGLIAKLNHCGTNVLAGVWQGSLSLASQSELQGGYVCRWVGNDMSEQKQNKREC